ncbi:MAG TPA: adenylate/guanylate cyclase domain-containing protein [Candidatus Accumulibacter phosphatis]|jgi:adenylate cyclase|nr:MAG: type VI secretion system FHA domain protein [Candidatus Accumulibacter sp. SK-11]HAY29814.1 adenylate/guanylate cyclase domain-containing protein [Accumulibacter sp.]HRL78304.1 adenylate/guanylate cyclase domain-containing protein [Candidatus Accumulibacter phosphatis]HCN68246.1 adenylate/guanylate cyclase domain-containing protein [Accumulibacter sp.]HCV14699.1 adenylate/guanylate cyclase domain-containing protein [Accumulibacter sp.]
MKVRRPVLSASDRPSTTHSPEPVSATVLFADICGSSRLFEEYGDWQARQIESSILDTLMAKTGDFDGTVIKTIGDEIMSHFPDAERAINAACEMHRALRDDLSLLDFNIAVKIGLQHGPVLVEPGDLFGDAVNVAARMVSLARADQIITTLDTVRRLPDELQQMTRSLGPSRVRGRQRAVEIVEMIWQEPGSVTQLIGPGPQKELQQLLCTRLLLAFRGTHYEVRDDSPPFTIGRGDRNMLVVDQDQVSRNHADIQFRQGKFILVDGSTNGTYLRLDNGARFFVQREEFVLHEEGAICLGEAVRDGDPCLIRFQCLLP